MYWIYEKRYFWLNYKRYSEFWNKATVFHMNLLNKCNIESRVKTRLYLNIIAHSYQFEIDFSLEKYVHIKDVCYIYSIRGCRCRHSIMTIQRCLKRCCVEAGSTAALHFIYNRLVFDFDRTARSDACFRCIFCAGSGAPRRFRLTEVAFLLCGVK